MDVQVEVEATRRRTDLVVAAEVRNAICDAWSELTFTFPKSNLLTDTLSWGKETYS
jgi:hypothetical protein